MIFKLVFNDNTQDFDVVIEPSSTDIIVPPLSAMFKMLALLTTDQELFTKAIRELVDHFGKNVVQILMSKVADDMKDAMHLVPNTFLAEVPLVHPIFMPPGTQQNSTQNV